jgi:hypothetical protein
MSRDASRVEDEFWTLIRRDGRDGDPERLYRYLAWKALRVKDHRHALRFLARGWLHRPPGYRYGVLAADLAFACRAMLAHWLQIRLPRRRTSRLSDEHQAWRNEGQAWVDALVAAHDAMERSRTASRWPIGRL